MEINLIPPVKAPEIQSNFANLLLECKSFIGCAAFWSIGIDFFRLKALGQALKKDNSFICADIQLPTNIDKILEYSKFGVTEIYLHSYRQAPSEYTQNTNLLHSKVFVFEQDNDNVEIWVGSHNLTTFALKGLNLESSLSIKCNKTDKIYQDVYNYLQYVKNKFCFKFAPNHVEIYKKLQTRDAEKIDDVTKLKKVVTLFGLNMSRLQKEEVIQLLSLKDNEFPKFKTIGNEIYLHCYDIKEKKEFLYKCNIEQSGRLDKDIEKLELDFTKPRRYAYIGTGTIALLKEEVKIDKNILNFSKYFVNISIANEIKDFKVYKKPSVDELSYWQNDFSNPYTKRLNVKNLKDYIIQIATFNKEIPKKEVNLGNDWSIFENKLKIFYVDLDKMINQEFQLAKDRTEAESNKKLDEFLKRIKNEKNIPTYLKSLVERIIVDLKNNN